MNTMSQGNKKITRKTPATNNKVLVRTGSLRFSQVIPVTNYKIFGGTGISTRDSFSVNFFFKWLSKSYNFIL